MEEFGWFNQHQQEIDETIMFGSENIFLNPIQPGSSPTTTRQLPPARLDSVNATSSFGSASQYWRQSLTVNNLHKGKNVIPLTPTTATSTSTSTVTPDYVDDISVIFSDYQNLRNKIFSDASVTKQTDDVIEYSQCSSEENPNYNSGYYENSPTRSKRHKPDPVQYSTSSTLNFRQTTDSDDTDSDVTAQMKEMIYRAAAFRPVSFSGDEVVEKPRRKNVRISSDPQTAAARRRREKISDRIRVLQKLVPGGNKMDTASMLDEAANYLKFLRSQVKAFEQFGQKFDYLSCGTSTNAHGTSQNIIHNVTLGVPFPMQTPFLLPYRQIYPTLPPA